jgi:hypothetical protein
MRRNTFPASGDGAATCRRVRTSDFCAVLTFLTPTAERVVWRILLGRRCPERLKDNFHTDYIIFQL